MTTKPYQEVFDYSKIEKVSRDINSSNPAGHTKRAEEHTKNGKLFNFVNLVLASCAALTAYYATSVYFQINEGKALNQILVEKLEPHLSPSLNSYLKDFSLTIDRTFVSNLNQKLDVDAKEIPSSILDPLNQSLSQKLGLVIIKTGPEEHTIVSITTMKALHEPFDNLRALFLTLSSDYGVVFEGSAYPKDIGVDRNSPLTIKNKI